MDKIGEVIGPKGKVINTIQQETGADIGVDDDGARGIVTIGAVEAWRMEEAKTAILNIVDPPKAELDKEYDGRVVNITKFGAFVNILPGRDGLLHISKMGGGKRINSVDDVLELGQVVKVKVEEIDDKGKVSLMLSEELDIPEGATSSGGGGGGGRDRDRDDRPPCRERSDRGSRDRWPRWRTRQRAGSGCRQRHRRGQLRRQLRRGTLRRTRRSRSERRPSGRARRWQPSWRWWRRSSSSPLIRPPEHSATRSTSKLAAEAAR